MRILIYISILLLQACGGAAIAPIDDRISPNQAERENPSQAEPVTPAKAKKPRTASFPKPAKYHRVVAGETLYSIAWRYHQDYKNIAAWNQIKPPYVIYPKQRLRLYPPQTEPKKAIKTQNQSDKKPQKVRAPSVQQQRQVAKINWIWPTERNNQLVSAPSKKQISIPGELYQEVYAAADGKVVFSGSGLLRYGNLIIIKHNDVFFSAYAYNHELLVAEGETVKIGQVIARMGKDQSGKTRLHFEIRKHGKPVHPLKYLPK